jgi:hypothetical protein
MQEVKAFFQDVTEHNFKYPQRVVDAVTYMGDLSETFASGDVCAFPLPANEFPYAAGFEYDPPEEEEEGEGRR